METLKKGQMRIGLAHRWFRNYFMIVAQREHDLEKLTHSNLHSFCMK